MAKAPVVVASTTRTAVLSGVMGVLRSLGPLGVPIHLVHPMGGQTPMARSKYATSHHVASLDLADPLTWVNRLMAIGSRIGHRPVLICTDDLAAQVVADYAESMGDVFRLRIPDAELSRALSDKAQLAELCHHHGVGTPTSIVVSTRDEARTIAQELGYPIVVKAQAPEGVTHGTSVRIVRDQVELDAAVRDGEPVLLQEHIPGGADSVWMLNAYFDDEGHCHHAFTGRKLRQYRPDTGYTSYGVCTANNEVREIATTFLRDLGYRGIVDLGMRFDARTGRYLMLDINPRLGATFRLFVGADGTDVVRALYGDLIGQPCPPSTTHEGRTWASEPHDCMSAILLHRAGRLTARELVSSYRKLDETAWWSKHDPKPFFAAVAWAARNVSMARGPAKQAPVPAILDHFSETSSDWDDVYVRDDVDGQTYRRRLALTLEWIDGLNLSPGSRVLDLGTGTGHLAKALAERGFAVTAVDGSPVMLQRATTRSPGLVHGVHADAGQLPFSDGAFDLVVALGLLPWVPDPAVAVAEMRRVCSRAGHVLVSSDSKHRLHWMLDPLYNPSLKGARRTVASALGAQPARRTPTASLHAPEVVNDMLRAAGARPLRTVPVGYGPFTFLGKPILRDETGQRLSTRLERLALGERPWLQTLSSQHLVLARNEPIE